MKSLSVIAALLALPLLMQLAAAQGKAERLYVIECGSRTAPDVSLWTPGINVGQPIDFVDTCYVIKHGNDWMVWDTGLPDVIFSAPLTDPFAWRRTNTLAGELDKIGIKPNDVKFLAVSHSHPDHIGSVELFPRRCYWFSRQNITGQRGWFATLQTITSSPSSKGIMMCLATAA